MQKAPKILTLTLNPALDKSTSVPKLTADKKLHCSNPEVAPGGGGVNVSRALHFLGIESEAMYLAGGFAGQHFTELLRAEGVTALPQPVQNELRENIILVEESSNTQYRFGMKGAAVSETEQAAFLKAVEARSFDILVASGSLPPGIAPAFFGELARIANRKQAKLIVDTSGPALAAAVSEKVFLIKPNLNELSSLYGQEELQKADLLKACTELIHRGYAEVIVVSMGPDGAVLFTKNEQYEAPAPKADKKSTVGAGDSMVAGLIAGITLGYNWQNVLRYGVAAGTAATLHPGTELCRKADVDLFFEVLSAGAPA